ncbi:retrovirus-related pol polyprotein from transposon TNT 1-94 [Tanacetum coccineum]
MGFIQSKHDYSLFINNASGHFMALLVYVDDVLVTGDSIHEITQVTEALDQKSTIKDIGEAKCFLGIKVCRTAIGTHLNQGKYIIDLLQDSYLTACKPNPSPLLTSLLLSLDKGKPLPCWNV